jgi:gamma-glutamyltranspeptidase/glutathione hydrolase
MNGAVATGHPLTTKAAAEMLSMGGNAFDAAVAAGFASVVTEPSLSSLGGGGFFLAHEDEKGKDTLFDFFVNTPGLGQKKGLKPEMTPVPIEFPGCTQVFHTGFASAAVPGVLKGLLSIHKKLCTLSLKTVLTPSLSYLEDGVAVNDRQEIFLGLLEPIMTSSAYGRDMFAANGRYAKINDRLYNPLLRDFFQTLCEHGSDIYSGTIAETLVREMRDRNGLITMDDLKAYEVIERQPLQIRYRDREVLTNPPPSMGGIKLALSLHLLEQTDLPGLTRDSAELYFILAEVMKEMYHFMPLENGKFIPYPFPDTLLTPILSSFKSSIAGKTFTSTQGTTQISVIDAEGNAASMTISNGSGSGCFIPGTGIMLNNMMGEDDLHPDGFFTSLPGRRVSSMMLPTMIMKDGKVDCVLGSGGSKRIRTAILQTVINVVDLEYPLEQAVESSRIHFEDDMVHVEPDVPENIVSSLAKHYNVRQWNEKNMYFGGVHCVNGKMKGWGDSRRGGSFMAVS